MSAKLVDFKGLHYSVNNYANAMAQLRLMPGDDGYKRPVDKRADKVHGDYIRHAKRLDREEHGLTEEQQNLGAIGPVQERLASYGRTIGLVFGSFGEGSSSLHALVDNISTAASRASWRRMGCTDIAQAKAFFTTATYKRWGTFIVRANARLRLARLELVGAPGGRRQALGEEAQAIADAFLAGGLAADADGHF